MTCQSSPPLLEIQSSANGSRIVGMLEASSTFPSFRLSVFSFCLDWQHRLGDKVKHLPIQFWELEWLSELIFTSLVVLKILEADNNIWFYEDRKVDVENSNDKSQPDKRWFPLTTPRSLGLDSRRTFLVIIHACCIDLHVNVLVMNNDIYSVGIRGLYSHAAEYIYHCQMCQQKCKVFINLRQH